jgi:glycine/D-amino acid oxidase-like deaminating enzyme
MTTNGGVSFWWSQLGTLPLRPALPGSTTADVCIVGAGYTGLWTAYYLKRAVPQLRVVVLEREFAGFGASGRNGGWLTNSITGGRERYLVSHGTDAVRDFQNAMNDTVEEVIRVARAEDIDADIVHGGELTVARNDAQHARLIAAAPEERRWSDAVLLNAAETSARVAVTGGKGALWHPHCARIQPAKLVLGLAAAVEALGVELYEGTAVTQIRAHRAVTEYGDVDAGFVVRATEGFTAQLRGHRRTWLPMNSSLIVTEPLPDATWERIGWDGCETLGDAAHAYMYAQRTADNRIALGGRGVPYRFGSRTDDRGATQETTIASLTELLREMFPAAADVPIAHAWCGVLGVPRDWCATVTLDRDTGLGTAGGYVGSGLTTTNLAGRTLSDLVLGQDTELTHLPWVNRRVRPWEPEPLRWLGVHAMYTLYHAADRRETKHDLARTSRIARFANSITGR